MEFVVEAFLATKLIAWDSNRQPLFELIIKLCCKTQARIRFCNNMKKSNIAIKPSNPSSQINNV